MSDSYHSDQATSADAKAKRLVRAVPATALYALPRSRRSAVIVKAQPNTSTMRERNALPSTPFENSFANIVVNSKPTVQATVSDIPDMPFAEVPAPVSARIVLADQDNIAPRRSVRIGWPTKLAVLGTTLTAGATSAVFAAQSVHHLLLQYIGVQSAASLTLDQLSAIASKLTLSGLNAPKAAALLGGVGTMPVIAASGAALAAYGFAAFKFPKTFTISNLGAAFGSYLATTGAAQAALGAISLKAVVASKTLTAIGISVPHVLGTLASVSASPLAMAATGAVLGAGAALVGAGGLYVTYRFGKWSYQKIKARRVARVEVAQPRNIWAWAKPLAAATAFAAVMLAPQMETNWIKAARDFAAPVAQKVAAFVRTSQPVSMPEAFVVDAVEPSNLSFETPRNVRFTPILALAKAPFTPSQSLPFLFKPNPQKFGVMARVLAPHQFNMMNAKFDRPPAKPAFLSFVPQEVWPRLSNIWKDAKSVPAALNTVSGALNMAATEKNVALAATPEAQKAGSRVVKFFTNLSESLKTVGTDGADRIAQESLGRAVQITFDTGLATNATNAATRQVGMKALRGYALAKYEAAKETGNKKTMEQAANLAAIALQLEPSQPQMKGILNAVKTAHPAVHAQALANAAPAVQALQRKTFAAEDPHAAFRTPLLVKTSGAFAPLPHHPSKEQESVKSQKTSLRTDKIPAPTETKRAAAKPAQEMPKSASINWDSVRGLHPLIPN